MCTHEQKEKIKILALKGFKPKQIREKLAEEYGEEFDLDNKQISDYLTRTAKNKKSCEIIEKKIEKKIIDEIVQENSEQFKTQIKEKITRDERFRKLSDLAMDVAEEYLIGKKHNKHIIKRKYYEDGKALSEGLETVELDTADTKAFCNIVNALTALQKGQRLSEGLDKDDNKDIQSGIPLRIIVNPSREERE